ncbi:DUF4275 family protein [Microbulbifer sp. ALW1]|uniref:DUF4275 family protein n=1 Tax=Microbulbifer sp. (strain ALW1) TaxID=1516059 RepID=UPI001F23FE02|nr:DUF4275 family protein [Microbulbifer sp. ALW1]
MRVDEIEPGRVLKIFDNAESRAIERKWMGAFCKNKQGFNTRDYKWHIFSGGGYPSIEGEDAQKEYERHVSAKYIVMSNGGGPAILTDLRPVNLNYFDAYVFPENMAWTMAFTHEEGWLGPYFAKHPNYSILEKENEAHRQKLEKIEIAKKKGWM